MFDKKEICACLKCSGIQSEIIRTVNLSQGIHGHSFTVIRRGFFFFVQCSLYRTAPSSGKAIASATSGDGELIPFAGLRTKVLGISFGESADRSSLRWCCAKSIGGIDFNCFGVARKNLMEYISCVTVNNGDASRMLFTFPQFFLNL